MIQNIRLREWQTNKQIDTRIGQNNSDSFVNIELVKVGVDVYEIVEISGGGDVVPFASSESNFEKIPLIRSFRLGPS